MQTIISFDEATSHHLSDNKLTDAHIRHLASMIHVSGSTLLYILINILRLYMFIALVMENKMSADMFT